MTERGGKMVRNARSFRATILSTSDATKKLLEEYPELESIEETVMRYFHAIRLAEHYEMHMYYYVEGLVDEHGNVLTEEEYDNDC